MVTVFVRYRARNMEKMTSIRFAIAPQGDKETQERIGRIEAYYRDRVVRYHFIPLFGRHGLIDSPVIYPELLMLGVGVLLYSTIVGSMWLWWF